MRPGFSDKAHQAAARNPRTEIISRIQIKADLRSWRRQAPSVCSSSESPTGQGQQPSGKGVAYVLQEIEEVVQEKAFQDGEEVAGQKGDVAGGEKAEPGHLPAAHQADHDRQTGQPQDKSDYLTFGQQIGFPPVSA